MRFVPVTENHESPPAEYPLYLTLVSYRTQRVCEIAPQTPSPAPQSLPEADARRGLVITAGLAAAVFFWNLGSYGLWEPDEARYAEIAREMLATRDFLVPHLNYVPYLEKPPLLYWLTALAFAVGGKSELSARLVPAVSALAGVFATWFFTARVFDHRRATTAAAILATAPLYAVMAQVLTTDMLLSSLVTVSLFAFFLSWQERRRWRLSLFYSAMGLGTLAKGPVAIVIPLLAAAIFLAWRKELAGAAARFRILPGLTLTLAIAAPWFVMATLRVPDFAGVYFLDEHIRRFFEPTFSHPEPFYFFVPVLIIRFLPWSILAPLAAPGATANRAARDFCLIAAGVIFVLFSAASGKLIPYILPAFAPLAVVVADIVLSAPALGPGGATAGARRLAFAAPIVLGLVGAVMVGAATAAPMLSTPYAMAARPAILAAGVIAIAGGIVAAVFHRRTAAIPAIIVATMAAAILDGSYARIQAEPLRSYASLCRQVAARAPDATLICYHRYVQALAYYSGRRVVLVGPPSELRFGMERSADAAAYFLDTDDDLLRLWSTPGRKVMLIDEPDLERLRRRLGEYTVIASALEKRAILTASGPVAGP
jgi:4-amino-4-deoxy-L-arabinose transferase-like glycosyltransferase